VVETERTRQEILASSRRVVEKLNPT